MKYKILNIALSMAVAMLCAYPAFAADKLIAVVLSSDLKRYSDARQAFVKELTSSGGDHIEIITQTPNPDPISWLNSIRKAQALDANVIVTFGAPATLAAMSESGKVPTVFSDVYGPVDAGISRSMSSTGRNIGGISSQVPIITLMRMFMDIKPVKTVGVIYNPKEIGTVVQLRELKRVAAQLGFSVAEVAVSTASALESALGSLLPRVDVLYLSESSQVCRSFDRIIKRATDARVPVISQMPDAAEKGALVTLEISPSEQGQVAADYVLKALAGNKLGGMPIATPRKIELLINLRTAKILDLRIPYKALSAATRILK